MNFTRMLGVMLVCVLPSPSLHSNGELGRPRRYRHAQRQEVRHHHHQHQYQGSQPYKLQYQHYHPQQPSFSGFLTTIPKPSTKREYGSSSSGSNGVLGGAVSRWSLGPPAPNHNGHALNNTLDNVTGQLGGSAFLPCRVGHLGERQISWIRLRDWHVVSSGEVVYSLDRRFTVLHESGTQDWTLHIRSVEVRDTGAYECQVSTSTGIISLFVNLRVIVPEAHILGQGHYHVNYGSPITLTCVIYQSVTPPQHVLWHHNGRLLNYASDRASMRVWTKVGVRAVSRVEVDSARDRHSGNYTCSARNTRPATTTVFVTTGDKTAAVQRIHSGCGRQGEGALGSLLLTLTSASTLVVMCSTIILFSAP